jgi:hypothetical protein
MSDTKIVRVEALKGGDILVLGPHRTPVIGVTCEGGKVLVRKCNASPAPLVYRHGDLVTILQAAS